MTPAGRISSCAVILETSWAFYGSAGTEAIRQRCHPQIHSVLSPPWTPCKAAMKSILKIPRSPVLYCKTLPGPLPGAPRIPGGLQRDLIELLGLILALKPRLNSTVLEALGRRRASSVNPGSLLPVCFLQIALESGALPSPGPLFSQVTERALSRATPALLEVSSGVIRPTGEPSVSGIVGPWRC